MTRSTLTRVAPAEPESTAVLRTPEEARKEAVDRAFEEGVRWFLAVSRRAVCPAA